MVSIRFLPYQSIDPVKWNDCINRSPNGLIYSTTRFLNNLCENWNALVLGDYEAVMPLCPRKKAGINYLYQPAFIQQQGIISPNDISENFVAEFLKTAFNHYRYGDITLNFGNVNPSNLKADFSTRNNYLITLDGNASTKWLSDPYLSKRYRRAEKNKLHIERSADFSGAVKRYADLYGKRLPYFRKEDYRAFTEVCRLFLENDQLSLTAVFKNDTWLGEILLLRFKDRWYNMISSVSEAGRKALANYFLFGNIIRELDGTGHTLDLEGSDHPGIGFFYKKMADLNQPYLAVHFNQLPFLMRIFKK